jgi:hypothetical protein
MAHAEMSVRPGWDFWISIHRVSDATDKEGLVCQHYSPHIGCRNEPTHTSLSLSGLRLGALRPIPLDDRIIIRVGGGGSFNVLDGRATGDSGLRADLLIPKGGQIGAFVALLVELAPIPSLPVSLEGGLQIHWVDFSSCSGEVPPQYDPFCKSEAFREIHVGLSIPFR